MQISVTEQGSIMRDQRKTIYDPDYLNESTADGCHPNDAGYLAMAKTIGETVKKAMSESKHSL